MYSKMVPNGFPPFYKCFKFKFLQNPSKPLTFANFMINHSDYLNYSLCLKHGQVTNMF